ncbi:Fanconi anemia group J protein isoform X1 [Tachysurus ichikawai]
MWNKAKCSVTQLLQCQGCVSDHADWAVIMAAEVHHPKEPALDQAIKRGLHWGFVYSAKQRITYVKEQREVSGQVFLSIEKFSWQESRPTHASAAPLPSSSCQCIIPAGCLTIGASLANQENTSKANSHRSVTKANRGRLHLCASVCLSASTKSCSPAQQVSH